MATKEDNAKNSQTRDDLDIQYTMIVSGLNHGGRNTLLPTKEDRNKIAILFDVVEEHTYTISLEKTSYAVESKSKKSDHAVLNDGKFSFSARINSSPMFIVQGNEIDKDTNPENPMESMRPGKSLEILESVARSRQIITLATEDKILENYIITNISAKRSGQDGAALVYDIELEEFQEVVIGRTVLAKTGGGPKSDPKKSANKKKGPVNSADTDVDVYERKSRFLGKNSEKLADLFEKKIGWKDVSAREDVKTGVLHADGTITKVGQ